MEAGRFSSRPDVTAAAHRRRFYAAPASRRRQRPAACLPWWPWIFGGALLGRHADALPVQDHPGTGTLS
jgi:hypothetical protein